MSLARNALLALCIVLPGSIASGGALAQANADNPYDFKPLIPPVFPLPPNSQLKSGTVGGEQSPYASAPGAPLRDSSPPAPGLKLTIPSR